MCEITSHVAQRNGGKLWRSGEKVEVKRASSQRGQFVQGKGTARRLDMQSGHAFT